MSPVLLPFREWLSAWAREYLSDEDNRRDAVSAASALVSFALILLMASHGMMPSYLLVDRPGRAMAVSFATAPELSTADLARTNLRGVRELPRTVAAPRSKAQPASRRLDALSAMSASRPDYFGRTPILPASDPNRPARPDLPERWQEKVSTKPDAQRSDGTARTSAPVSLPTAKISGPDRGGSGDAVSDITFDVTPSGGNGTGSDFITLSGRSAPSSVGQPGGKQLAARRPITRAPLPDVPDWFEQKGLNTSVMLRIVISVAGKVELAEVEKTSGFKEIDADVRTAVMQWQFVPSGFRESIVVKINYKLR